jgi:hypothetical protein
VNDANELLRRIERQQHLFAQRLVGYVRDKILRHAITDVRFQQRLFDQRQALAHVGFAELGLALQGLERRAQTGLERFKHRGRVPSSPRRAPGVA